MKTLRSISVVLLFLCLISFKPISEETSPKDNIEKIIGADISFLPQLEDEGVKFTVDGKQGDAIQILKEHGFNYIRLRIFVNPEADSGYSKKGYCGLEQTKKMAKRIKDANLKFLLDFHYSDTWADGGKQYKPAAWKNLAFPDLVKQVHDYSKQVITELVQQGTPPDMVQVGNEIRPGMLFPDGSFDHPDNLAALLKAGTSGVKEAAPNTIIMMHIDVGGDNTKSVRWLDAMISRGVNFDVIGESYYPYWHGTLDSLQRNLNDLSNRYSKDVIVAEYSKQKVAVNDFAFNLPHGKIKGTFIWEPLNYGEAIFDEKGESIDYLLNLYPEMIKKYDVK